MLHAYWHSFFLYLGSLSFFNSHPLYQVSFSFSFFALRASDRVFEFLRVLFFERRSSPFQKRRAARHWSFTGLRSCIVSNSCFAFRLNAMASSSWRRDSILRLFRANTFTKRVLTLKTTVPWLFAKVCLKLILTSLVFEQVHRKYFNESRGLQTVKHLCAPEYRSTFNKTCNLAIWVKLLLPIYSNYLNTWRSNSETFKNFELLVP